LSQIEIEQLGQAVRSAVDNRRTCLPCWSDTSRMRLLRTLTPREREVLALMAEGHTNGAIAELLVITETAVSKHIGNIFGKLNLAPSDTGHRRVLAVLAYLRS
jgi:DNA-binding NarL/FixJ family response regulator